MVIFASLLRAAWLDLLSPPAHAAKLSSTTKTPSKVDVLIPVFSPAARLSGSAAWTTRRMLEARVRIELTIEVLQTSALPLGYRAVEYAKTKSPRICRASKKLERETGIEPATSTLARSHSTAELLPLDLMSINDSVPAQQTWRLGSYGIMSGGEY